MAFGMVGTLVPWVDPEVVPDSCIGFLGASRDRALRAVVQEFREPAPDATRAEAFPHRELAAGRWVPRVEVGLGRARDPRAGCRAPRHSRPAVWAVVGFEAGTDGVPHRWTATVGWTLGSECRR